MNRPRVRPALATQCSIPRHPHSALARKPHAGSVVAVASAGLAFGGSGRRMPLARPSRICCKRMTLLPPRSRAIRADVRFSCALISWTLRATVIEHESIAIGRSRREAGLVRRQELGVKPAGVAGDVLDAAGQPSLPPS